MKMSVQGTRGLFAALAVVLTAVMFSAPVHAQSSNWQIDPAHANAQFSVRHLSISNVSGQFNKMSGTIQLDDKDVTKSVVNATVDVSSVDTRNEGRDNDLKSDHFFDVAKYPTMTFVSTKIESAGPGKLKMTGNLTLHGVTKPIVLTVEGPSAPINGMDKKPHVGFSASTTLHRLDFGVGSGFPAAVVSDDVQITIDLDAAKQ
jgi:polyisoprenoid-binding protein YceI